MKPNRDLLVLVKDESCDKRDIQNELEQLNQLLFYFETLENFCLAHEVFDMNRYKILHKPGVIQKFINQKETKPFIFICNKN